MSFLLLENTHLATVGAYSEKLMMMMMMTKYEEGTSVSLSLSDVLGETQHSVCYRVKL